MKDWKKDLKIRKRNMTLKDTINYFLSDVEVDENGCWKNRFYKSYDKDGYLKIGFNNNTKLLPRLILIDRHGEEFMKNYVTRHLCHNRRCINPWHIIYGTNQDNVDDKIRVGNGVVPNNTGSKNGRAKLIEEEVKEIKALLKEKNLTHREIAKRFGVSNGTISKINIGILWSHIDA